MIRRFFVERQAIAGNLVFIEGELFRHIVRVLRMKPGDRLNLADGQGGEYSGIISAAEGDRAIVRIEERGTAVGARRFPAITLFQGIPKGERMELILQKATELGAGGVVPFLSSRTVPRLAGDKAVERRRRWERIVAEAARQSCRSGIPAVGEIISFTEAIASARQEVKLLLWEGERENSLKGVLESTPCPVSLALLVGPEGGLSEEEAAAAMAAGFVPVTLGPCILRTETAGLAVLSILQYVWGDMGYP